ncbi:MAG TPA: ATP-binding cassette domain-containing protein [Anaerolineaceae bacterium]|nr:ATP-binding cassette domain-containing protein [Anaerolineaceae bacterium]HPN50295.1 ATP-binding cassette domain-containing protein [Anaerolineaceae bacterium]
MNAIIKVEHLSKTFEITQSQKGWSGALRGLIKPLKKKIAAVKEVSFELKPGELVGYLGPNGAGKSTTLKMLTGLLVPTSGVVQVNGLVPWRDRTKYVASIGAVFGQRTTLWWDLPVQESFDLIQYMYRIPDKRYRHNMDLFRDILGLDPFINTPVRSLSLGQRMRADLCAALLHDPKLLFLDEPTIGLDVVAKDKIRQFIKHVNEERKTTIILTTHDLQDVEKLCERVIIIDHGQLLFDGTLEALNNRFGGQRTLQVDFAETYPDVSIEGAGLISHEGLQATYQFDRDILSASDLISRLSNRYKISDLSVREPAIEDTIRRIYVDKLLEN